MAEPFEGGALRRQVRQEQSQALAPHIPAAASPAGGGLQQSCDVTFYLSFSLIVQVSDVRAFLPRIGRREEKAKENFKGTRMRKLIYPEKTSFHLYYEMMYVYVLLMCIHVPTYIRVGITELL